jgi:hypothetical protein
MDVRKPEADDPHVLTNAANSVMASSATRPDSFCYPAPTLLGSAATGPQSDANRDIVVALDDHVA